MRSHRTEILNINLREEIFVKTNTIFNPASEFKLL